MKIRIIVNTIVCILIGGWITSCALVPSGTENFKTFFDYGKYHAAVHGSMAGLHNTQQKKQLYYSYAKLTEFGAFPRTIFNTKVLGIYNWARNEDDKKCPFNDDFSPSDTYSWTQETLAKYFYYCSATNGYSPAMLNLALLISEDEQSKFGTSYYWLKQAAELNHPEALNILDNSIKPKLLNGSNIASDLASAAEIDSMFHLHNPSVAKQKWTRVEEQNKRNKEGLKSLYKLVLTAAIVSEVTPNEDDTLKTRARKAGFLCGLSGSNNCSPSNAKQPVVDTSKWRTTDTTPAKINPLRSVSADLELPKPATTTSQTQQKTGNSTSLAPRITSSSVEGQCSSDFNCGSGQKCVKAPLATTGSCMIAVDNNGLRTFPVKDPNSILPNSNVGGQCSFNTDCPVNFTCDEKLKVCRQ